MSKLFVRIQCELPTIQSFLWSVLSGVVGTLILAAFLSGMMQLETVSKLLPVIVGLNAAISGYMLIERTAGHIRKEKTMASAVGTAVAVLACVSINALCLQINLLFLIPGSLALAAAIMGVVAGWSGGILAVKYRELQKKAAIP